MIGPNDRLAALFAADLPPARDPTFQAEVLAAVARREFQRDLMSLGTLTAVGGALLWVLWPAFSPAFQAIGQGLAPGLICAAVAASVAVMARARFLAPGS